MTEASGSWFFADAKSQRLEASVEDLKAKFKKGEVHAKTLVWRKGMQNWQALETVPALFQALASASASSAPAATAAPKASSTDEEWFYVNAKTAKQEGPVGVSKLASLVAAGTVDKTTFGWKEGMADWVPLSTVPSLQALFEALASNDMEDDDDEEEEEDEDVPMQVKASKPPSAAGKAASSSSSSSAAAVADKGPAEWFYVDKYRAQKGPISVAALVKLYGEFQVNDTTMVWKNGLPNWLRLSEVAELAQPLADEQQAQTERAEANARAALNATAKPKGKAGPKQAAAGKAEKKAEGADDGKEGDKESEESKKRKREKKKTNKKNKWKALQEHANIYVTGLPPDLTQQEAYDFFKKAGIIKEDPATKKHKIKLYEDEKGNRKGDGLVSYLKPESVELAITLLDNSEIRPGIKVGVQKAEFKMKGEGFVPNKKPKLDPKAKESAVIKKQMEMQKKKSLSWGEGDEEEDEDGLRIVIMLHMFNPKEAIGEPSFYDELRLEIGQEIEKKCGPLDKLTLFENSPVGAVAAKFKTPTGATKCIELMNGRFFGGQKIECAYWDGVTNYKVKEDDSATEQRLKEFGDWLEST